MHFAHRVNWINAKASCLNRIYKNIRDKCTGRRNLGNNFTDESLFVSSFHNRESNQQRYRRVLYSHIKEFSSSPDIKVEDPPRNLTSRQRMHLRERPLSHNFPTSWYAFVILYISKLMGRASRGVPWSSSWHDRTHPNWFTNISRIPEFEEPPKTFSQQRHRR